MKKWLILIAVILLMIPIAIKIYMDTNHFKVNRVAVESEKIPDGAELRILQISDLHNKTFDNDNEKLIRTVENLNADIIVITGDLIDRRTADFKPVFALIEKITAIHPDVYFVTGNHEWEHGQTEEFLDGLRERNVIVLHNQHKQITADNITFNLAGVDDASTDHENVAETFNHVNDEWYTILLSHAPEITKEYEEIPADLILSGHTHGGQVRIPFIGALVAPGQGLFPELEKGTYNVGEDQYLYIDSGLGTSVAPIRFLNKSQLSFIILKARRPLPQGIVS